jgi:hypothetical protein
LRNIRGRTCGDESSIFICTQASRGSWCQ